MPAGWTVRALHLRRADGSIETFARLVDYMVAYSRRSRSWQDTVARGLGLFWDFCQARGARIAIDANERGLDPQRQLFRHFAISLLNGTISDGDDPDGLFWPKTPLTRSREMVRAIEAFSEWVHQEEVSPLLASPAHAVPRDAMSYGEYLVWARVRRTSMLSHLQPSQVRMPAASLVDLGRAPQPGTERVKFFPPDQIERLLWEGHRRPGREHEPNVFARFNIRDQMIVLLDAYGGFRRSEGLHLWVQDVVEEPGKPGHALVVINHPAESKLVVPDVLTGREYATTREEALNRLYGLRPRHLVTRSRYHAGWKGMDLNQDLQAFVYWLDESAGALFWVLYLGYLKFVRGPIMARRASLGGKPHPFLFVTEGSSRRDGSDAMIGDPYPPKGYERNHEAAVLRIGLEHAKALGTTTHGLRHLYGRILSDLGLPPAVIRKGLHHRHYLSQVPYTVPSRGMVNAQLETARRRAAGEDVQVPSFGHDTARRLLALREHIIAGGPLDA
jgi:integrase